MRPLLTSKEPVRVRTRCAVTAAIWWVPTLVIVAGRPGADHPLWILLAPPLGLLVYMLGWLLLLPPLITLGTVAGSAVITLSMIMGKWKPETFTILGVLLGVFMLIYLVMSFGMSQHSHSIGP